MISIKNISKYKAIVLIIGVIAGLAIVGQPIAVQYIDCPISKTETEATSDDQNPQDEQVSSFEAVTPAQQVQDASTDYFILDEYFQDDDQNGSTETTFVEKISKKLIRVLFNNIIAPNAP